MNKVILMGRLTKDCEVRYKEGETPLAIARFSLAVDRRFAKKGGDEQTADFPNCIAFGKTAEFLEKFGRKGTKFVVEGRIQTGSYTDKEGKKVYTTDVVVEQIEFAESKNATATTPAPASTGAPAAPAADDFMNIGDVEEDLPFGN